MLFNESPACDRQTYRHNWHILSASKMDIVLIWQSISFYSPLYTTGMLMKGGDFHLQAGDADGGRLPLLREQERQSEREGGQISSGWSAGVERGRERDL